MPITLKRIARLSWLHSRRPVALLLSYHSYGSVFSTCNSTIGIAMSWYRDIIITQSCHRHCSKTQWCDVFYLACSDSIQNNGFFLDFFIHNIKCGIYMYCWVECSIYELEKIILRFPWIKKINRKRRFIIGFNWYSGEKVILMLKTVLNVLL